MTFYAYEYPTAAQLAAVAHAKRLAEKRAPKGKP